MFSIPKKNRTFLYDRKLLGKLSQCATSCLKSLFRITLGKMRGIPGIALAIQTFGDYARWHPHVHALVADGLFKMFTPLEFIAAITQRIPERLAQMVRYYGWKILSHLGLLSGEEQKRGQAPPKKCLEVVIEPFEEGWPEYGETFTLVQA